MQINKFCAFPRGLEAKRHKRNGRKIRSWCVAHCGCNRVAAAAAAAAKFYCHYGSNARSIDFCTCSSSDIPDIQTMWHVNICTNSIDVLVAGQFPFFKQMTKKFSRNLCDSRQVTVRIRVIKSWLIRLIFENLQTETISLTALFSRNIWLVEVHW